ncbi:MAG TPA: leucyl aminopeptidase [Alcanivoracaceae bacterium]|nr:leucyl aminopeptidase [Alcanivoracaceae bacterium]
MEYAVSNTATQDLSVDCLVVCLHKDASNLAGSVPAETQTLIQSLVEAGDFTGKKQQVLTLFQPQGLQAKRLILVGTGVDENTPLSVVAFTKLATEVQKAVASTGAATAAWFIDNLSVNDKDKTWHVREASRTLADAQYSYTDYKSKKAEPKVNSWLIISHADKARAEQAHKEGIAIAAGMALTKDLANCPPNDCYPEVLADLALELAEQYPALKVNIITEDEAEEMGMGAFCAVARGSEREGRLIVFEYGNVKDNPAALVGKGITFDTGGISLKPGAGMDEMKYDMGGAASVFGTMKTLCELEAPVNVVGVVVAAENMPDGRATRPGDIVTTLSGQTVEILNTDAEGRLVLCDALTYVQQEYDPSVVVDIATLTGACVIALGAHAHGIMANDGELAHALLEAGDETGDRGWPLPLWDEYQPQLDSPFADIANIGGREAGTITAACFLSRFTKETRWAHLDIAGTAWISGGMKKAATGRPVPLLTRFILNGAGQ